MNDAVTNLITALREELSQYGEMLALLDQEQELVMARGSQELLDTVALINQQGEIIRRAREQRGVEQRRVARELGLGDDATFADLQKALPENHGMLVNVLVNENNELLLRVRSRARQNHVLLTRSLELMQKLIGTLFPNNQTTTYGVTGQVQPSQLPRRAFYEAVG